MAQPNEPSLLDKLLKTRYPLTNYLSRQQQFSRALGTPSPTTGSFAPAPPETAKIATCPRKTRALPSASGFNVPDTLDPFASESEPLSEMSHNSRLDDENSHDDDETLPLKSMNNHPNDSHSEETHEHLSSIIKRSSAIQLEFSPMEFEKNSPLQRAIQTGLNVINK